MYTLRDASSCPRREKPVPYSLSLLFLHNLILRKTFRFSLPQEGRSMKCKCLFLRESRTVGAGTQKEPSQTPGAWWKFSRTSRVNCLLMKAYASHLLATEELERFQKHSKTDIPSNTWCERVIHTENFTPLMSAGPNTDTYRHWGCRIRATSLSHINCHCPLRIGTLPV